MKSAVSSPTTRLARIPTQESRWDHIRVRIPSGATFDFEPGSRDLYWVLCHDPSVETPALNARSVFIPHIENHGDGIVLSKARSARCAT